jgi:RimJ/RimL family protein N-acetyltransferase/catechol 2,3-dioxygenase-like lactoylglutathione lyase family enzyme
LDELTEHLTMLNALPKRLNWAIVMIATGHVAGRVSYAEAKPADRWLEIGTMITPPFWGSPANPESKLLLMTRAFEVLGANRVHFKVDARNARSQAAIEKIGAVREGTLRQYQIREDGFVRDSVMYSVLTDEWPAMKTRLIQRLSGERAPSQPPPTDGLLETSLYVDDLARAVAFYQRVFGFALNFQAGRLASLAVRPGQLLLLFTKQGSAHLPTGAHHGDGNLHLAFAIGAGMVERWRAHLGALGIAIEEETRWERGGTSLYFRDPDGHLVEVASPGVWENY